jgi:RiboL-PSP-HEPN
MNDVERVYHELSAVRDLLRAQGTASDVVAYEELGAKTLLLCAASYFERTICSSLLDVAKDTGSTTLFCTFIEKQALERKFHSMFDWDRSNANKFFGLFGQEFSGWIRRQIKDDSAIEQSVREFMFVNNQRNILVHGNFAAVSAGITFDEAWDKYITALKFVEWLPPKLREAGAGALDAAAKAE